MDVILRFELDQVSSKLDRVLSRVDPRRHGFLRTYFHSNPTLRLTLPVFHSIELAESIHIEKRAKDDHWYDRKASVLSSNHDQLSKDVFDRFDSDKDGFLSQSDLAAAFQWMYSSNSTVQGESTPVSLVLSDDIALMPVEENYLLYDQQRKIVHVLNGMAGLLIELCNGRSTRADAAKTIASLLDAEESSYNQVLECCDKAVRAGILVDICTRSALSKSDNEMSSTCLSELANQLINQGEVALAYQCQQRAVELRPRLPRLHRRLGELAQIAGMRQEARTAYESYVRLVPEDAEIQHLLISLRDEQAPARVPNECILQLYERFSSYYESNMCGELQYEGPKRLQEIVDLAIGKRQGLSILDLGCGTGLAGEYLRPIAARLVGVDLSPDMAVLADERKIYDDIIVGEISHWLETSQERFDLIVACDSFIYFGDLGQVVDPASRLLNRNGILVFSVEHREGISFRLTDSGRYVHGLEHIVDTATNAGLRLSHRREGFLRMEYGEEVNGLFVTLERNEHRVGNAVEPRSLDGSCVF